MRRLLQASLLSLFLVTSTSAITCGCDDWCTPTVLDTYAGQYKCGDRITWLMSPDGGSFTELDACRKVAGDEFPTICGPMCDPDRCNSTPSPITPAPTHPPVDPPSSLYCFPNDDGVSRVTYLNMWNEYKVQVKEGNVCGPGDNRFSRNTVSKNANDDELIMQFKLNTNTNVWEASEVRVTQMSGLPFSYGNFTFHIKSVTVKDSTTDATVSDVLPTNMVLGLFTWDPTDRYSIHENWNHEVDIEISRWGVADNADTQFLVQPPRSPQMYRFFSGTSPNTYEQSNQWHSFRWLPNVIYWNSTAGNGHSHSYSTEQAVINGIEDFVQCLPADVEIRINLWSIHGLNAPPQGLTNDQYVEVVIDKFVYDEATGVQYAAPGDYCSKHCQCEAELGCVNGKCIQPPTTSSPSDQITSSPSATCEDSTLDFLTKTKRSDPVYIWENCAWVAADTKRCRWRDNKRTCPLTCNSCDQCLDSKAKLRFYKTPGANKLITKKCRWTKKDPTTRCAIDGMDDACREACGKCN